MAAKLEKRGDLRVELKTGGPGELRVTLDGQDVFVGSRLWYPRPSTVLSAVEKAVRP